MIQMICSPNISCRLGEIFRRSWDGEQSKSAIVLFDMGQTTINCRPFRCGKGKNAKFYTSEGDEIMRPTSWEDISSSTIIIKMMKERGEVYIGHMFRSGTSSLNPSESLTERPEVFHAACPAWWPSRSGLSFCSAFRRFSFSRPNFLFLNPPESSVRADAQ